MTHRERMIERRKRQHAREPGFSPSPNKRIGAAFQGEVIRLMVATDAAGAKMTPTEAHEQAWRNIARTLPAPASSKLYRPRSSKSDSPAYRKPFVRAL